MDFSAFGSNQVTPEGMKNNEVNYYQVRLALVLNSVFGFVPLGSCRFGGQYLYPLGLAVSTLAATTLMDRSSEDSRHHRLKFMIQGEYLLWLSVMHYTHNKYTSVLNKTRVFDVKQKYTSSGSPHLQTCVIYGLQLCLYVCDVYLKIRNGEEKLAQGIMELCYSYMVSARTLALIPFIVTSCAIAERFVCIKEELQLKLIHCANQNEIETFRIHHLQLCGVAESLITTFSFSITLFFGLAYYDTLVKVSSIVCETGFNTFVDPVPFVITAVSWYVVISVSEQLLRASQSVTLVLQDFSLDHKDNNFFIQINQFTLQVRSTAVKVSAGNYFVLRKKSFPSIIGSMTSFVVVVVQLIQSKTLLAYLVKANNTNSTVMSA